LNQSESYLAEAEKIARESGVRQETPAYQHVKAESGKEHACIHHAASLLVHVQAKQVTTKAVLGFPRDQILLVAEEEVSSNLA
jgi:hypothetical protein